MVFQGKLREKILLADKILQTQLCKFPKFSYISSPSYNSFTVGSRSEKFCSIYLCYQVMPSLKLPFKLVLEFNKPGLNVQYRSKISWQSLETLLSILKSFEARGSSIESWVEETNELVSWLISWEINLPQIKMERFQISVKHLCEWFLSFLKVQRRLNGTNILTTIKLVCAQG